MIALLKRQETSSPFLGYSWFKSFSDNILNNDTPACWITLETSDTTQAILPMLKKRKRFFTTLASMSNYYTPYFGVISNRNRDSAQITADILENFNHLANQCDIIDIKPITEEVAKAITQQLRDKKHITYHYKSTDNWRTTGIESWIEFWNSRGGRLKQTVKRKTRKMEREGNFSLSLCSNREEDFDKSIADFHEVYRQSWKKTEPTPKFITDLASTAQKNGQLRLGTLHHQGKPIASQLWLVADGTAYIFKLSYVPEYKHYSAGTLLSHFLFKHVIEKDRVHTIDYLTGNDAYKQEWMAHRRDLYGLLIARKESKKGVSIILLNRTLNKLKTINKNITYKNIYKLLNIK